MLHLDREPGQFIVIGDGDITIKVVSVEGKTVRLSIHAPRDVKIIRQELLDKT